jgi:hypothetical protein
MQRLDGARQDERDKQGERDGREGGVRYVKQQPEGTDHQQFACIHPSSRAISGNWRDDRAFAVGIY